jgi:hypothetical protein
MRAASSNTGDDMVRERSERKIEGRRRRRRRGRRQRKQKEREEVEEEDKSPSDEAG